MNRTLKLTTVLGIPVEINYSWFVIFGLVAYTLSVMVFPSSTPQLNAVTHWIMGLSTALALFLCLLLHELAHSFVAIRNKLPILGITLFIFGGVAHMSDEPESPEVELKMAIAGPIVSILLGTMFLIISILLYYYQASKAFSSITEYLMLLNFSVAIFNLFPGFPLDGGRIFRSLLWKMTGDLRRATLISTSFGKGFAFFIMAMGFYAIVSGDLLRGLWLIFLGFFLMEAAESSYRSMRMKKVLSSATVSDLMTRDVIIVPAAISINRLIEDYFFKYRFASFPVAEDDTLLGIITFHDIKEISREKWGSTTARGAMIKLRDDLVVDRGDDLAAALGKMINNPVGRVLVIENGKLAGILSKKDIVKLFEFREGIGA